MTERSRTVQHPKFGLGTVIAEDYQGENPLLHVDFVEHGKRKIAARFVHMLDGTAWPLHTPKELRISGVYFRSSSPLYKGDVARDVVCVQTQSEKAMDAWHELRRAAGKTGLWPVLIDGGDLESIGEVWEFDEEMAELRRAGSPAIGMHYLKFVAGSPAEALALAEGLSFEQVLSSYTPPAEVSRIIHHEAEEPGMPDWLGLHSPTKDGPVASIALVTTAAAWAVPAGSRRTMLRRPCA